MVLSLNKLPWYAQVGVFVVLALAGGGAFYYFHAAKAYDDMASRRGRLTSLRAGINKGLTTARKLPEFRREVGLLEAKLEGLRAVLPEEKDVADLLRRIQTLATQSNLTIRGFKPEPIATRQLHAEWPIALELDGTYHNLGLFFDRISKFSRIINVNAVSIKGKDKPEPNSTIAAECVATTFVLLESPGKGMTPKGAAAKGAAAKKGK